MVSRKYHLDALKLREKVLKPKKQYELFLAMPTKMRNYAIDLVSISGRYTARGMK